MTTEALEWTPFECEGRAFEYAVIRASHKTHEEPRAARRKEHVLPWVPMVLVVVRRPGQEMGPGNVYPEGTVVSVEHAIETARVFWAELTEGTSSEPTPLEDAVMRHALAGSHPVLNVLRVQWSDAKVQNREFSGVGVFATIEVSADARPLATRKRFAFGDVIVDVAGAGGPVGMVIFVDDGRLALLEMYVFDGSWPKDTSVFSVRYSREPRALGALDGVEP